MLYLPQLSYFDDGRCHPAGGSVLTVLFAALIGGFALGQAAPNVQFFATGMPAVFSVPTGEKSLSLLLLACVAYATTC